MDGPEVTLFGIVDMQVCVPAAWFDAEVQDFADRENPTELEHGWKIRKEGHPVLNGAHERVECGSRLGYVHIMLEC